MPDTKASVSPCVKWSVFTGIYLVRFLSGIMYLWGNLSTYVMSFFIHRYGPDGFTDIGTWLVVTHNIALFFGIFIGALIGKRIGPLTTIVLGTIAYNGSICFSYMTVQHSYPALCVTFGLITGLCSGITEANQFTLMVRWTDRYYGLTASSILSMPIFGILFINLLITFHINPENVKADLNYRNTKMFSQPEIIDRVPVAFLLFGGISVGVNFIGFLLLRDRPGDSNVAMMIFVTIRNVFSVKHSEGELLCPREQSVAVEMKNIPQDEKGSSESVGSDITDLTPMQILKTKEFYTLWLFMAIINFTFIVVNNYYKTFGLLYISDDHFLASTGTLKCLATAPCIVLFGYVMDRIGVKETMLGLTGLVCILASFFYVTPIVNEWLFLIWWISFGCIISCIYCLVGSCCLKILGRTHFSANYGVVLSGSLLVSLAIPSLVEVILSYGWSTLFYSIAACLVCGFCLILFGLPATSR